MLCLTHRTLEDTNPSQQLDQTPLTQGVGAGENPWYVRTTVFVFLKANLAYQ